MNTTDRLLGSKEAAKALIELIAKHLEDDKAEQIEILDLEGKADFAYFIVIASGRSSKHIASTADKLADTLKEKGIQNIGIEGQAGGNWVLLDAHDVIVHLFRPEVRSEYEIEKIWGFKLDKQPAE
ncbi:MAG: ribosome silencing factor [Alphaproteobacteria bacterium]|jgi:ribosome-associated protein|nr:ribosome silencing factor [Candidatus Jidaibacter sp.]